MRFLRFLLLLSLLLPLPLQAQWHQLPGPYGGIARSFAQVGSSNIVLTGTIQGVYRTTNGGDTWVPAGIAGESATEVATVASATNASVAFAITSSGLMRSLDSGTTWSPLLPNLAHSLISQGSSAFAVLTKGDTAFDGIYRSTDLATWTRLPLGAQFRQVTQMVAGPTYIWALLSDGSFWRSGTAGANWDQIAAPLERSIYSLAFSGSTLFAGLNGGIAISIDNGGNWILTPSAGLDSSDHVTQLAVNGLSMVAVSQSARFGGKVSWTSDGGRSWTNTIGRGGYPLNTVQNSIAYTDGKFFSGCEAGIYTSKDGQSWTFRSEGERAAAIHDLAIANGYLFSANPQGIFRSADQGKAWTEPSGPADLADSLATNLTSIKGELYASGNGLWKLAGQTWVTVSDYPVEHLTASATAWYAAAGWSGAAVSTDNGTSWMARNDGLPTDTAYTSFVFPAYGKLFATVEGATIQDRVYVSSDEGGTWALADSLGGSVQWYADTPLGPYLSTLDGLYRSTDNGVHWSLDTALGSGYMGVVKAFNGGVLAAIIDDFTGNKRPGFYFTADGVHWMPELGELFGAVAFASDGDSAFAGTWNSGVWSTSYGSLGVAPKSAMGSKTGLQFFPNPTQASTTVKFDLTAPDDVDLTLFDAKGEAVQVIRQVFTSSGSQFLTLSCLDLPSGTYVAVLKSKMGVWSSKLVVRH